MVHADLQDAEVGAPGHTGERQRHAPKVVVAALAGGGDALGREHRLEGFLGAGLADASGNRDDVGRGARAGGAGEMVEPLHGVVDDQERRVPGQALGDAAHHRRRRAALERPGDELVGIVFGALDGDEEIAGMKRAAVDGNALGLPGTGAVAAGRGVGFDGGPQGGCRRRHHDAPPMPATALRTCSRSSKGMISPPTIWPLS